MKVLYVDVVKSNNYGGASTHRFELMRNLAKCVEIYCMTESQIYKKNIHCLKIKRYNNFTILNKFTYLISYCKCIFFHKYDIIYIRNVHAGLIGFLTKKITGSKLVFELNSITKDEIKFFKSSENQPHVLKILILEMMESFLANNSDAIIAVTDGIKEYLVKEKGVNAKKIKVISNGSDIELFKPIEIKKQNAVKHKYNVKSNDLIILFQGSLVYYQGVENLIKSAPIIVNEVSNVKFLIIGEGVERLKLEKLVEKMKLSEFFIFTGRIKYNEMPYYINLSDVCVAPFIRERNEKIGLSPLKLYEYLACGKPVVASDIKGIREIEESNSGLIFKPEDPVDLAENILKLLKSKNLREKMGENGRKICLEKYNWGIVAKETKKVFDSIIT